MEIVIRLNEEDLKNNAVLNMVNNLFKQNEELDALIERYKKEFKFDLGETMVEEAFKKQGIKIKW